MGTLDIPVRNPEDILSRAEGEGVVAFTIDLPTKMTDFLERYAAFRNKQGELELAAKPEKKAKPGQRWTRKSVCEFLLREDITLLMEQTVAMEKALGPVPAADDEEAVMKYAARAIEWRKKKSA